MGMLRNVVKHMLIISDLSSAGLVLGQEDGAGDQEDPSRTPPTHLLCHWLSQLTGTEELGHLPLCLRLGNSLLL